MFWYEVVLGCVVYLNSTGAVVAATEYSPYGRVINVSGSTSNYPIGYCGQYTDSETGLVYYGARYYNPKHGRFVNRDPIEEQGGNNLYAFCHNNSTNRWDVLGMMDDSVEITITSGPGFWWRSGGPSNPWSTTVWSNPNGDDSPAVYPGSYTWSATSNGTTRNYTTNHDGTTTSHTPEGDFTLTPNGNGGIATTYRGKDGTFATKANAASYNRATGTWTVDGSSMLDNYFLPNSTATGGVGSSTSFPFFGECAFGCVPGASRTGVYLATTIDYGDASFRSSIGSAIGDPTHDFNVSGVDSRYAAFATAEALNGGKYGVTANYAKMTSLASFSQNFASGNPVLVFVPGHVVTAVDAGGGMVRVYDPKPEPRTTLWGLIDLSPTNGQVRTVPIQTLYDQNQSSAPSRGDVVIVVKSPPGGG